MRGSTVLGVLCWLLTSGCYFLYPAKAPPKHTATVVLPGEEIEIKTRQVKTFIGSCSDASIKEGKCEYRDGKWKRWYMQTHARLKYGGKNLNYAEYREVADPDWPKQIETMKKNKRACTISLVPSGLAVASAAAGVLIPLLYAGQLTDQEKRYFYAGGGAGFVVFGGLSYPLGGYACRNSHNAVKAQYDWKLDDFEGRGELFEKVVENFNAKVRNGGVAVTPEPASDEPPPSDGFTAGTSSIMKTLADAGEYSQFAALLVETGIDKQLAKGGPYTVAALTDASLSKYRAKLDGLGKAERLETFQDLIFIGVVSDEGAVKTLSGKTLKLERRKDGMMKVRGKAGTLRLVSNATNGVIYAVE